MTAGTARTGRRPRTWVISGWAGTARLTTGWSPSPRCGPMSASTTPCMRCRTRQPGTLRKGRTIRRSGPSCRSAWAWRRRPGRRGSRSGRSPRDSAYGDQDGFRGELSEAGLPFVMALKPRRGTWAYGADAYTPVDAARALAWHGPADPGDWCPVTRTFRDGHTEPWFAADATLGCWGPDGFTRLVVATADPGTLPAKATSYLATNLPCPGGPREPAGAHPAPALADIVTIYCIRHWIEQSYKQVKDQLGCADFPVRSDTAIRRHQALVNCAFCFCWHAWFHDHPAQHQTAEPRTAPGRGERGAARHPAPARAG